MPLKQPRAVWVQNYVTRDVAVQRSGELILALRFIFSGCFQHIVDASVQNIPISIFRLQPSVLLKL
jgi:hypothetical protein